MTIEQWLEFPATLTGWLLWLLKHTGSVSVLVALALALVLFRPRVLKSLPKTHRQAVTISEWTLRISLTSLVLGLLTLPPALSMLKRSLGDALLDRVTYTLAISLQPGIVGIIAMLIYLAHRLFWFRAPRGWKPDRTRLLAPRARRVVFYVITAKSLMIITILGVSAFVVDQKVLKIDQSLGLMAIEYAVLEAALICATLAAALSVDWRPPIPRVPYAIDLARRRVGLDRVLRISCLCMGSFIACGMQVIGQLSYRLDLIGWAWAAIVTAWVYSLLSIIITILPTRYLMRSLDPSSVLVGDMENSILRGDYSTDPDASEVLPTVEEIIEARQAEMRFSKSHSLRSAIARRIITIRHDAVLAPGSGSSPEDVAEAAQYLAELAVAAGKPLTDQERASLEQLRTRSQQISEARILLYQKSGGQAYSPHHDRVHNPLHSSKKNEETFPDTESALDRDDDIIDLDCEDVLSLPAVPGGELKSTLPLGKSGQQEVPNERKALPIPKSLAVLSQDVAPVMVGLDAETRENWAKYRKELEEFEKEMAEAEEQEASMREAEERALAQYAASGYLDAGDLAYGNGYDPYAGMYDASYPGGYDPAYGYDPYWVQYGNNGYGYSPYPYPYPTPAMRMEPEYASYQPGGYPALPGPQNPLNPVGAVPQSEYFYQNPAPPYTPRNGLQQVPHEACYLSDQEELPASPPDPVAARPRQSRRGKRSATQSREANPTASPQPSSLIPGPAAASQHNPRSAGSERAMRYAGAAGRRSRRNGTAVAGQSAAQAVNAPGPRTVYPALPAGPSSPVTAEVGESPAPRHRKPRSQNSSPSPSPVSARHRKGPRQPVALATKTVLNTSWEEEELLPGIC